MRYVTRKKRLVRRPRKKPDPPQPKEPEIEITREDGIGQPQQGGPTGPYPDQIAPPYPRLDSSGQQQGGGTYEQDQMNLQNMFTTAGGQSRPIDPIRAEAARKQQEARRARRERELDRRAEMSRRIRERRNPRKAPQPREPQIEITQKDGFGQIPPPPPPQPQPWAGQGPARPWDASPTKIQGRPQQQGGVRTGINPRTGQPGHPMRASSIAPQQQGMGRPQQQGMGRPQGGMPGNVGGGTKRPIGVPPGAAGGTPRGY